MSDTAIRVEKLSKKYVLGENTQEGYITLREKLTKGTKALSRRLLSRSSKKIVGVRQEEFWALKDLSFGIEQGEAVSFIGRNGAGKSTLLKVLSRITEPTKGRISIKGRVASLLEVGTGFHQELTGRENIYLNGAILGMSKVEIKKKFDEIVAFAEVEKFLDTPVKRYSSGMYVRLAFAVAAHLEPEILIVDEVLAVGDAGFQKKCLGKMGDVANKEGRTVLFVSHNMQAVSQLTKRCILLSQGEIQFDGDTDEGVKLYLGSYKDGSKQTSYYEAPLHKSGNHIAWARIRTSEEQGIHYWGKPIAFEFALSVTKPSDSLCFSFQVMNEFEQGVCIFWLFDSQVPFRREAGEFLVRCEIPKFRLYMGSYTLRTWFSERRGNNLLESLTDICPFEVTMQGINREEYEWKSDECSYLEDAVWKTITQA